MPALKTYYSVNVRVYSGEGKPVRSITSGMHRFFEKPQTSVEEHDGYTELVEWFDTIGKAHERISLLIDDKEIYSQFLGGNIFVCNQMSLW